MVDHFKKKKKLRGRRTIKSQVHGHPAKGPWIENEEMKQLIHTSYLTGWTKKGDSFNKQNKFW